MKKLLVALIIIICLVGLHRVIKSQSDAIYNECMEAGVQSQERCYFIAYIQ